MSRPSPLPAGPRQQSLLRGLATLLRSEACTPFLTSPVPGVCEGTPRKAAQRWRRTRGLLAADPLVEAGRIDTTAICLGLGVALANSAVEASGDGGWLTASGGQLTAADCTFLLAAQLVTRARSTHSIPFGDVLHGLAPALRRGFAEAVKVLSTPAGSLVAQLGLQGMPTPSRRDSVELEDGSLHFVDFDHLLGVERKLLPRRGLLRVLLPAVRLRCSACRTPLPGWAPVCVGCGRAVKGERPLTDPS